METSIPDLESSNQDLKEMLGDFITMVRLNIQAIEVSSLDSPLPKQISRFFDEVASLSSEIEEKRLQLLITDQIGFEDIQLRRERMQEYEEKIHEKRRAVADKEAVFQGYTNPRKKRSQLVRLEEFEKVKAMEKLQDNSKYLIEYERRFEEIKLLNDCLKRDNKRLSIQSQQMNQYLKYCKKRLCFMSEVSNSPEAYELLLDDEIDEFLTVCGDSIKKPVINYSAVCDREKGTQQLQEITVLIKRNKRLMNSLKQETELLEYLCEENSSLVERYQMGRESYTQSSKWHTESTTEVL